MGKKASKSTELRPEGARLLDAPLVSMDIPEFIRQIKAEVTWQTSDRNAITVFKTDGLCMVLVALRAEAVMEKYVAQGVISAQVIEGEIYLSTNSESLSLRQNDIVALHAEIPHSIRAIKEAVLLLTFTKY